MPSFIGAASRNITSSSYNDQSTVEHLEMIEQPYQRSKLRYRADYTTGKRRVGSLGNKSEKSKFKGPAIRVSLINNLISSINFFY